MIGAHNGPFRKNRDIAQAGLDFDFRANLYQKIDTDGTDMARTSTLSDLVTVSRASTKTNAGGWDFTNGGTVGTLTEAASNTAATYSSCGILIEESSTNEIRNPRCEGAVTGSPGTLPTNWSISGESTLTRTIVATGTASGWPYIDIRYTGTATTSVNILTESVTQVVASVGQTWTKTYGVALVGGDLTNISAVRQQFNERTAVGANLAAVASASFKDNIDSQLRLFFQSHTLTEATAARISNTLIIATSGAVDFTLRLFGSQLEQKAYASSPIFPPVGTPGASTRAIDEILVPNAAWQSSGKAFTMLVDVAIVQDWLSNATIVSSGPDNNNRANILLFTSNRFGGFANAGGVTALNGPATDFTGVLGTYYKVALGVDDDDFAVSATGATQTTDVGGIAPAGSGGLTFARSAGGGGLMPGMWLRDFRYFPERLTNAQLEALVGN